MRYQRNPQRRKGATMLENAIVLPIVVLLMIGLLVAGLGAFRSQQVATLAREGARYASVRGSMYASETGNAAATPDEIYTNAILPLAAGMDVSSLSYSVTWPKGNAPAYADSASTPPGQPIGATVVVTVSYTWVPEAYSSIFGGGTLTSTSIMPMHY